MPYVIEYSPEAEDHLRLLSTHQQRLVTGTIDRQLLNQPTIETKNRKPMRPNPVAPWELRIGYQNVECLSWLLVLKKEIRSGLGKR